MNAINKIINLQGLSTRKRKTTLFTAVCAVNKPVRRN